MTHERRPITAMTLFLVATIVCVVTSLPASMNLPLVDPGLFVISGVKTCGDSAGYCLLGTDCTMDDDFLPDSTGNCDGLKRAFTPSAPFACCKFNKRSTQTGTHRDETAGAKTVIADGDKLARNTKENVIDPSKFDSDQLAKLNQIESVVKKIVEQLINETANSIRTDETVVVDDLNAATATGDESKTAETNAATTAGDETRVESNTQPTGAPLDYSTKSEDDGKSKSEDDGISMSEDDGKSKSEDDGKSKSEDDGKSEIPTETHDETGEDRLDADDVDDEFKYEKNICQKTCKTEMMFTVDKKPMCYGTLLDDVWILTSATCATRLNKAGLRKIVVSRKDNAGVTLSISNLLVHENFKSPASKNSPENNDLALASLSEPLQEQGCIPCFNQKRNITNDVCKNSQHVNVKNSIKLAENCEGRIQQRKLISKSYLVLPCHRWRMQHNQEGRLGSGLWCDGKLAGVQTGVGVGSLIYTPVNEYAAWISDNKRIEKRR